MSHRDQRCGVEVCLDKSLLSQAPHCPHGPTLVFERYLADSKKSKQFFACSAYRDRKLCPFFCWVDDKKLRERKCQENIEESVAKKFHSRREALIGLDQESFTFCQTCSLLLSAGEVEAHSAHFVLNGLSKKDLQKPMQLLQPLSNNRTHAQFLFSESTLEFLCQLILADLSKRRVLCIGTPRLYERLRETVSNRNLQNVECLLLDLDQRLEQFYSDTEFCSYNMFNHHFFDGESSHSVYKSFLCGSSSEDLLVVIDPPFGGLVEVISWTLNKITWDWRGTSEADAPILPTLWFFPYFMESRIVALQQTFSMLDYRVSYANHSDFSDDGEGSPVRIFTNIDPQSCVLPTHLGYRLCSKCWRYVAAENKHCSQCNQCTTKVGSTYKHCNVCKRCVKSTWTHCTDCSVCELSGRHTLSSNRLKGCHICGELGHKRRECPTVSDRSSVKAWRDSNAAESTRKEEYTSCGTKKQQNKKRKRVQ